MMRKIANSVLQYCLILPFIFLFSCTSTDEKYGVVELFHGAPKPVEMIPRAILGNLPSGPFPSHRVQGILVMDTGCDYQGETSLTYLTHLLDRYVSSTGIGDLPFHYFIDLTGRVYAGRSDITPAELHEGDPFTLRPDEVTKKEIIYARVAAKRNPVKNLDGFIVICVLGNYDERILTEEQEKQLFQLCAYLSHNKNIPLENIKALSDIYPATNNPGFYLENYLQRSVLVKNIPPPPGKHRFIPPEL